MMNISNLGNSLDEDFELQRLSEETSSLTVQDQTSASQNGQQQSAKQIRAENDKSDSGSHLSQSSRSMVSSAAARGATKVYYHIDDEQTPYCTEVPVPQDRVTLADFKRVLNRTNFKFYCKAIDSEVGGEVKAEIRDDTQPLSRSSNGQFELFLLTAEGSSHSDGASSTGFSKLAAMRRSIPGPAPLYPITNAHQLYRPRHHFEPHFGAAGHRRRPFEDSTAYTTETEGRIYSDDESRLSTSTDNITSVSRQHYGLYRRRRRQLPPRSRRQPSRASSLSSMTETSMALEVITVTLNMDTVNFLGISIVGQSSSRGDNGIYVASVMPGGAVALDGCIEPGDMILQVNDISFENFKNDQAVEVLKQAVSRRGPIKLTVAKSFDAGRANYFSVPAREPVRPIDTHAWVQHTNAVRGMSNTLVSAMNAIPEGSEGAPTPIPGQYPPPQAGQLVNAFMSGMAIHQQQHQQNQQRPASSSTTATSNGSGGAGGGAQTILGPGGVFLAVQPPLDLHMDRRKVVQTMAAPNSGLDIRDRTWLKIPIPMSFLGSSLVDWLLENVNGLRDRKEARRYAADLLKERLIAHVVNKQQFTEQCYYVFGDECAELLSLRNGGGAENGVNNLQHQQQQHMTSQGMLFMNQQQQLPPSYLQQQTNIGSSEYASMPPVSPYPPAAGAAIQMMEFSRPQQQQQMLAQQPQKFSQTIFGPGGLNPMVVQQHHRMAAADHQQQQQQQPQMGTTSQTSNNSNEESSGSEQRRKAILPPAPSLTSLGGPQHQQQAQFMQQQKAHQQQQYNATGGAPPSTPIGEEAASLGNAGRFAGQTFQQKAQARIAASRQLAEAFPEVFVEHF